MKMLASMIGSEPSGELMATAGKAAPSITVSGLALAGVSLQDWVFMLTAIYTALQIFLTIRKAIRDRKR